jgi:hypothetical protein
MRGDSCTLWSPYVVTVVYIGDGLGLVEGLVFEP